MRLHHCVGLTQDYTQHPFAHKNQAVQSLSIEIKNLYFTFFPISIRGEYRFRHIENIQSVHVFFFLFSFFFCFFIKMANDTHIHDRFFLSLRHAAIYSIV